MQDLVGSTVFKCLNLMIMPASSTLSSNMRWCLEGSGAIDTRRCLLVLLSSLQKKKKLDSKKQNHHGHLSIMFKGFKGHSSSPMTSQTLALIISPNGSRLCNWQPILFAISCAWFTLILGACNVRQATYHDQIFEEVKHRVFWGVSQNGRSTVKDSFSGAKKNTTYNHLFNRKTTEKKNTALNHRLDALSEGLSVDFGFLRYAKITTRHVCLQIFTPTKAPVLEAFESSCGTQKYSGYLTGVGKETCHTFHQLGGVLFSSNNCASEPVGTQGKNPPKTISTNTNWREGNKSGTKETVFKNRLGFWCFCLVRACVVHIHPSNDALHHLTENKKTLLFPFTNSGSKTSQIWKRLPSKKKHIPPGEKENHLQNAIFGGYVSFLEGNWIHSWISRP